jgi:hypothetical protein
MATLEVEALKQPSPRERLAVQPRLLGQELEGGDAHLPVERRARRFAHPLNLWVLCQSSRIGAGRSS